MPPASNAVLSSNTFDRSPPPIARAFAARKKAEGRGLNALVAEKTMKLFGKNTAFAKLTPSKQNCVFAEIVASAGRSQHTITRNVERLSYLGRSVILLSLALTTYNVLTARSKSVAVKRELVTTTAGIGGSIAAGALAGLACGPGAGMCDNRCVCRGSTGGLRRWPYMVKQAREITVDL